jgi:lipoprotein-anchoring transpeptidase ErfK/SrfK
MDEHELEQRLSDAFTAQARASVGDRAAPPAPRFLTDGAAGRRHRRMRVFAPLAAAAAVLVVAGSVLALRDSSTSPAAPQPFAAGSKLVSSAPAPLRGSGTPVRIRMLNADGATYGVGMPIVALFSRKFANAASLAAATSITVDGKPVRGAWYFEYSSYGRRYPVEGHLRLKSFWPAHAKVRITLATRGVSAGRGYRFQNAATLDFSTGAKNIAVVDDADHRMTVTTDGKPLRTVPVSLGTSATPTMQGTKVIMEKGRDISMSGPGYFDPHVKYTQQLTYGGEYLMSAPWNVANIKSGVDTSNGCTNLLPSDAAFLYKILHVGDVVMYPNADGPAMTPGMGYGDWNVPWSVWQRGGLIPTA